MTNYGGMQGKPQAFLNSSLDAEDKPAYPFKSKSYGRGVTLRVLVFQFPVMTRYSSSIRSLVCLTTYP
jgi:hypothetical protein